MKRLRSGIRSVVALGAIVCLSASALRAAEADPGRTVVQAGNARAELSATFGGLVKGSSYPAGVPTVITDEKELKRLWKAWKPGEIPKVDFSTQFVTIATWGGSQMEISRMMDESGNLNVSCGGGTKDGVDGFTYLIEVYSHTGVKSVNGQILPDPAAPKAIEELNVSSIKVHRNELDEASMIPPSHFPRMRFLAIKSLAEARKYFVEDDLKTVAETMFGKEIVLVFAWSGAGGDDIVHEVIPGRITFRWPRDSEVGDAPFEVAETTSERVLFHFRRGQTKDNSDHTKIYRLRSDVKWELAKEELPEPDEDGQ